MSASVAWALLATRASGACLLLLMYGWPAVNGWYRIMDTSPAPMSLGHALALALGLFASAVCPCLVALGLWPRWAAAAVMVWLGTLLAAGGAHMSAVTLSVLYVVLAVTGPGPLTLAAVLSQRRRAEAAASAPPRPRRAAATGRR